MQIAQIAILGDEPQKQALASFGIFNIPKKNLKLQTFCSMALKEIKSLQIICQASDFKFEPKIEPCWSLGIYSTRLLRRSSKVFRAKSRAKLLGQHSLPFRHSFQVWLRLGGPCEDGQAQTQGKFNRTAVTAGNNMLTLRRVGAPLVIVIQFESQKVL